MTKIVNRDFGRDSWEVVQMRLEESGREEKRKLLHREESWPKRQETTSGFLLPLKRSSVTQVIVANGNGKNEIGLADRGCIVGWFL